jgi:hypothetical protein
MRRPKSAAPSASEDHNRKDEAKHDEEHQQHKNHTIRGFTQLIEIVYVD